MHKTGKQEDATVGLSFVHGASKQWLTRITRRAYWKPCRMVMRGGRTAVFGAEMVRRSCCPMLLYIDLTPIY